ncbi:cupin domain-containing protein [Streptomyces litchfieldiae]|uniref:Cupin domain-containing protein n=1 Tax=Streptomyces litchfieldiae TaxID=3075543 RepID=A0ABU2MQG8_9ACTN|nr:cupin domain-containing protein [Streptomyces sp. DSM 44938]MDT0343755.1 cupin domain-containing protein [Streptomyces sp. DSM 44938]
MPRGIRAVRAAVLAVLAVAVLATLPSAGATPGRGVTAETLAEGTSEAGLAIRTTGRTDVTVRVITIAPGGSTGLHHHPGPLIAVVESGTLTRTLDDCSVEVSTLGDTVLEPAGRRHVHLGRNLGTEPVVLYATYFVPEGSPLSVDAADPGCGT